MINLLPTEIKEDISYARRNTTLRRWIAISTFALIGVGIIVAGGLILLQQSVNNYSKQVAEARNGLAIQKVEETQKRVDDISANTKLTVQVLSREVLFSKLLRQIGSALPSSTALKALQIDKVQGGVQLNAAATDFNAATQLQINLQDPKNGVFEKADINSITCATGVDIKGALPCDVNLRALFSKNNSYVYIAPGDSSAGGVKP
jgi:Tfp pilus assembly protein PilN